MIKLSLFGEEIINRLDNHYLKDENNPMNRILNYTVGDWLENEFNDDFFEQFFLNEATGEYLDLHGLDFGVKRRIDESDIDYRKRIIYESLGHLTFNYFHEVHNVDLYSFVDDFNVTENTLVSDNPYYNLNGFLGFADEETKQNLNKRFIIEGITWL